MSTLKALLLVTALLVGVSRGQDDRETFGGFTITQWSSSDSRALITLVEDAVFSGDSLDLTGSSSSARGAVWTARPYRLKTGFLVSFNFELAKADDMATEGGEGMAFVLQTRLDTIVGDTGAGMGYANINSNNYLALEFDSKLNAGAPPANSEPNDNHVALVVNGVQVAVNSTLNKVLNDGDNNAVSINYTAPEEGDASGRIVVTLGNLDNVIIDTNLDLTTELQLIDGDRAYLGFTAATASGLETQAHRLRTWTLTQYGAIIDEEDFYWFTIAVVAACIGLFGATACIVMGDSRSSRRDKKRRKKKKRERELKKWERDLESREKAGVAAPATAPPPAYSPAPQQGPVLVAGGAQMAANIAMGAPAAAVAAGAPPPQYPPQGVMIPQGMPQQQQMMAPQMSPQMAAPPMQMPAQPQSPTAVPLMNGSQGSPQAYLGTDGQGGAVAFQIPELDGAVATPGKAATDRALGRANSVGSVQQIAGGAGRAAPALRRANTDRGMGRKGRGRKNSRQTAATIPAPGGFSGDDDGEDSIYADQSAYARPTVNLGSGGAPIGRGPMGGAPAPAPAPGAGPSAGRSVKAMQGFDGLNPDDLSFPKGVVIIVEQDRGDWLYGKYQGNRGWFPANAVEDI